jgi:hypothetical protein
MFEFQDVFASHLTATVFVSASLAMLTGYAIATVALCRGLERPRALDNQPRTFGSEPRVTRRVARLLDPNIRRAMGHPAALPDVSQSLCLGAERSLGPG